MNYSIIGNSLLSVKIAEELRQKNPEAEISLFCPEGLLPYHRHLLAGVLSGVTLEAISCVPQDFYAANRINVITDKKIIKIHPKRKRILTEAKEQIPFDVLMIDDGVTFTAPDIKGAQKQGVFHLKTFEDVQKAVAYLGLAEIAVVEAENIIALQAACQLRKLGKEVIVVSSSSHILADILDKDVADHLTEQLQKQGLRFIFNNGIAEVLGDADAKAIRLKTGKVFEGQIIIFSQADKNLNLFSVEDLSKQEAGDFIKYEDIYCAKDLKASADRSVWEDFFIGQYALALQGKNIVQGLSGEPAAALDVPLERVFSLGNSSVVLLGTAKKNDVMSAYMKVDYKVDAYKKIFVENDVVQGAALINRTEDVAPLLQLIREQKNIQGLGFGVIDYKGAI